MKLLAVTCAVMAGLGTTLILPEVRWFRRVPLEQRLAVSIRPPPGLDNADAASKSLADRLGDRLATVANRESDIGARLELVGRERSESEFRARQLAWSAGSLVAMSALLGSLGASLAATAGIACCAGAAAFLIPEQRLGAAISKRRTQLDDELPVVAEQIGMLLASGMSLTSSLSTVCQRGRGVCAADLQRVSSRVEHGTAVESALAEWADAAGSTAVRRLVAVLTLHEDTSEVAVLATEEARAARAEAHRRLVEHIERRNEQVWIPVTVAALIPGAVLLAIPFSDALHSYSVL